MWTTLVITVLTVATASSASVTTPPTAPAPGLRIGEVGEDGADERFAEARGHAEAGRRAEAIGLLSAMLEEGAGDDKAVRLLLSDVQIAAGNPQAAVETLTNAPDPDAELLLHAGRAFKAWGDRMVSIGARRDDISFAYDEARSWLGQAAEAAEAAPDGDTRAAVELGFFELYVASDADAAMTRADALLKRTPEDGELLLLRGCAGLFVSIRDADAGEEQAAAVARGRAIEDLVTATKQLPEDRFEPWVQLAWLYEADEQPTKAVRAAAEILERVEGADLTTLYHLATRYAAESQWEPAGEALWQMARRRPDELTQRLRAEEDTTDVARRLNWAAGALVAAGNGVEARDALAPVVAADPQDGDLWNNFGFLCRETREYEQAYEAYEKALSFQPDNPRLMNDTGLILHYYLHRDYDRAADLYARAVEKADEALQADELTDEQRAELELARTDAVGNLQKLAAGDYDWP
ncbi:MAG: tetratricopeptide repeat protein [Planctomycetota bacterium]|jgi:tetratricopeptide (TPR) repeat protein